MDVPQYPQNALAMRADGHVEVRFHIENGGSVNVQLVGPSVSPELTILREAALANMRTWRFGPSQSIDMGHRSTLLARFDYKLPEKCGQPWSVAMDSGGEIQITAETPCVGQPVSHRPILHFGGLFYPPIAKTARIEGVVKSEIKIDKEGFVTSVTVLEGHPMLRQATIENLKKCVRFAGSLDTAPSEMIFYLHYRTSSDPGPTFRTVVMPDSLEFTEAAPLVQTELLN